MKYRFSVALQPCGSCVSHSHCKECCAPIEDTLRKHPEICEVNLEPVQKILSVDTTMDPESLEDFLDDSGIYPLSTLPL